ncbi:MAG: type II toxin-antitoxin system prevent-host-death family antitoxin [Acidobacteria bacterium]|nr:type II toxin-antitoxin system prevent-host-death family antitoxin [Acidobacteriota bacterium]
MSSVGLRELKNQLSKYVQRVKSGETVLITDRGEIVAEMSPPKKQSSTGEAITNLDEMRRKGLVYNGGPNHPRLYPRMPRLLKRVSSARLLDEERGLR